VYASVAGLGEGRYPQGPHGYQQDDGLAKGAIPKDLMVTSKTTLNELCKPSK